MVKAIVHVTHIIAFLVINISRKVSAALTARASILLFIIGQMLIVICMYVYISDICIFLEKIIAQLSAFVL